MMKNRREFLIGSGCALVASSAIVKLGAEPLGNRDLTDRHVFEFQVVDEILRELFGTFYSTEDASLRIDLPTEVQNPEYVPFRVAVSDSDRIAIFVEENRYPLLLVSENGHRAYRELTGVFRLERGQQLTVYSLHNGNLHKNERKIRWNGHVDQRKWSAMAVELPPVSTILRAEVSRDGINILCSIYHQDNSLGIKPYIQQIKFSVNEQVVSILECGLSIAHNPRFSIHLKLLHEDDIIQVDWNDSDGNKGHALGTVGLILNKNLYREI
ncbi:MAG: thiosulfate oxidation carrier complex protein SoxZ [Gammaproteobacteria bacterium]|nr:thiosulfate oxidation carrier complex protein SoxZ [Gammaproteobacteria bacterium]MCY4275878.1 thiosulfate oxidation carrier complex protein SoxZ [Gammaproteobacteria bacterium]